MPHRMRVTGLFTEGLMVAQSVGCSENTRESRGPGRRGRTSPPYTRQGSHHNPGSNRVWGARHLRSDLLSRRPQRGKQVNTHPDLTLCPPVTPVLPPQWREWVLGDKGRFWQSSPGPGCWGGTCSLIPRERMIYVCLFFYPITFTGFLSYCKCSTCSV